MNDKLHPALAEHAMERENERLRGLLAQLSKAPQNGEVMTRERLAAICEVGHDRSAFVAALSQQAEPRCEHCDDTGDVHRADGEWLGECKECNQAEPAPAQDEREVSRTAPDRIYLVIGDECPPDANFPDLTDVTWCEDNIDGNGIEYLRRV